MKSLIMEALSCLGFSKKACGKIYPKSEYLHPVPTISCLDYCSSHPIGLLSSKLIELRSVLYKAANVASEGGNHIINSSVQTLQRPSYSVMSFCYISWPFPFTCHSDPISYSLSLSIIFPTHWATPITGSLYFCSLYLDILPLVIPTVSAP